MSILLVSVETRNASSFFVRWVATTGLRLEEVTMLNTGAVHPHIGFEESSFFIPARTGQGLQVLKMLPALGVYFVSMHTVLAQGLADPYVSVGTSKQEETLMWLPQRAGSSVISWCICSLTKKAPPIALALNRSDHRP
jgi:hypothetical protein